MSLRMLRQGDHDAICMIRQDPALLDLLMSYPAPQPATRAEAETWIKAKTADQSLILRAVTWPQDTALGYVQITGHHRKGRFAWFGIALCPQAQGQGAGRTAMQALLDMARTDLDLRKLLCEVRADNARALALYGSLGFVRAGTLAAHYRDLSGTWRDVHILECALP